MYMHECINLCVCYDEKFCTASNTLASSTCTHTQMHMRSYARAHTHIIHTDEKLAGFSINNDVFL